MTVNTVLIILTVFFLMRIVTIVISIKNEKRIKKLGATEHGKLNSALLTVCHILIYAGSFYTAYANEVIFNFYSQIGVGLLVFSYAMLFYVMYALREIWTVKIYIVPGQRIVKSFLFRTVRHPNYFLNVMPEILGVILLCNAWDVLLFIVPLYVVILMIRIYQEETVMKGMI